ncbi:trifunctional serine/threonine-protein kinase/ATP-binding protein/sensor histidine kinase [Hyalangium minutum]|uniref:Nitrogen regulation protein NtrB n=1 Tax=Hyalangium minutum TaxID=394096 RepID=A0A085W9E1_9BACT|nr:ATP-binding sensor histidine kinase [Hyalangium minutum]KFE64304.1 nitrogen regulation protein NtrB [Hyalangium minutum]
MLNLQGYTFRRPVRATGSNMLFQAVREVDGAPVIIKTPVGPAIGPREDERYRREYGILQRLRGVRGVTRPYGCERVNDRPILVLEEVQGVPLSEAVGRPFELARFLELAVSLTSTLAEIHLQGVIHKDIKPSNIIVTPTGEPHIIDFGAATLQRTEHVDAAPTHLIEGTLAYMSPEQTGRMNRALDYRTDFYSLGVTFYELLTGARPFQGGDALAWFHAHMALLPRPPHELISGIPPVVSAIVMRCLAKVAEERYQSAEGLMHDLAECVEGLRRGAIEDFVLGKRDIPSRFQLPQRLYGRDAHVATLLRGFERIVSGGKPELILVRGYSGIGKSSVVHELHKPVVQRRGFFLSGKFDQLQRDVPYATLAQAIRGLVQQLLAGTDAEVAQWRERLREALQGNGQVIVELVPQLALVMGPQAVVPELPPAEAQHRFNQVFLQFLGAFATVEHPLVMFLDDLQWADLASLRLLQFLLIEENAPPVLWIGAYRDNEVSLSHPLMMTLGEVRKAKTPVTDLQLEPLSLEQVQQLVGDALPGAGAELIVPLSEQVQQKTGGNPFFLLQLMLALHHDGLLSRAPGGGWRWEAEGVRAKGYSDNIVDFMARSLHQLPASTQHLLPLAACVGNSFSLGMLAVISGMEADEAERGLEPALQEGLVVRSALEEYRFLHDRIQQAAHAFILERERKAIHLRIGRLLLEGLSPEEVREKLFEIVSQLNTGVELISSPEERHRLARLNAEAGWKARASSAHGSAAAYLSMAFALIPGDPWATDHALAFKVQLEQASSELMSGNAAEARRLLQGLRTRVRSRGEIAAAYGLMHEVHLIAGELQASVTCLLESLSLLGMPMDPHPSWEEAAAAREEVLALLGGRSIESLVDLPLMTDADMKPVMSVLARLFPSAYLTDNNLLVLHVCRMVALSLRYGNTNESVIGYSSLGVLLGPFFKSYQEGHAYGLLACALIDRYNLANERARALFNLEMISYWCRPLAVAHEHALSGFQHALQTNNYLFACYIVGHLVWNRMALGHNLDDVYQDGVARMDFMRKTGFVGVEETTLIVLRYVQQLRGLAPTFGTLDGDGFDEKSLEAALSPAHMSGMVCQYWLSKMQARFMCGSYGEARAAGDQAAAFIWAFIGIIPLLDFHLFRALTLVACCEGAAEEERQRYLKDAEAHWRQLEEWADTCPGTFRALERLVFAELSRLRGRLDEALPAYEEALRMARENGFIQHVALACELAANFYRRRQAPFIAEAYARQAREAYAQWGAHGKVKQLDALWPSLVTLAAPASATNTTTSEGREIDALAVVKAQQAVSSEIVLERLVSTLMRVATENAGAQRGALLLPRGDKLVAVAVTVSTAGGAQSLPPEEAEASLPWTILSYVRRTREHVLIGDASAPHPFSSDPYLARSGAWSVLCLPLMRQESLSGVMYLENRLASGAFTPGRIMLLGQLASQAAISIENARLYAELQHTEAALRSANDELERRVDERTRELKQAQAQLVDTARAAGMAEVASDVLHNVGNVLTSAVINLDQMRSAVAASRLERAAQLSAMLKEHRENLVEFLTHHPRGRVLPDYLSALTEELRHERTQLRANIHEMGLHIEHIHAIIRVQQDYAKSSLMLDKWDLAQLIEDSLRFQLPTLQRHGVSVTCELANVPRVRVDKHKVLQILINLLRNAKDAMAEVPEEHRHVCVKLGAQGHMARIQVVDSGKGFTPEIRKRLFSHGFTTRKEGHGFGLHSSALAAQAMGGRLLLESEGPGKGATATLELPLQKAV